MSIKCQNQGDGSWMVHDTKTGRTAYIRRITEMFMGVNRPCGYRVDVNGKTFRSAIDKFQTARAWANKYVGGIVLDCGCLAMKEGETSCECGRYDTEGGTL